MVGKKIPFCAMYFVADRRRTSRRDVKQWYASYCFNALAFYPSLTTFSKLGDSTARCWSLSLARLSIRKGIIQFSSVTRLWIWSVIFEKKYQEMKKVIIHKLSKRNKISALKLYIYLYMLNFHFYFHDL